MIEANLLGSSPLSAEMQQPVVNNGGGTPIDLKDYVKKTTTIAGVDLQDDITASELREGLNVADGAQVNAIESISAGGTALTPDANKNVNIPYAGTNAGVVKISNSLGMGMTSAGIAYPLSASTSQIDGKTQAYNSITPSNLNYAVKSALTASNHLTMTSEEKTVAQEVLGFIAISQADYDLLDPPDPNTYYFII